MVRKVYTVDGTKDSLIVMAGMKIVRLQTGGERKGGMMYLVMGIMVLFVS